MPSGFCAEKAAIKRVGFLLLGLSEAVFDARLLQEQPLRVLIF